MAHTLNTQHSVSVTGIVTRALQWIWNGLIMMGENSARARVLHQIGQLSDAELQAIGVTRADLVKRVMSDGYHL